MLLGVKHHQRFAPAPQRLPAQQVEVLGRGGGLADLHVVPRGKLQEALEARARVLRPLPLVTVRQQQDQPGEQSPLVLARGDELIDDNLRAVGEVSELRFPQHQRLGIIAAVAILETQHGGFRERRVVNLEAGLLRRNVGERRVRGSFSVSNSVAWRWLKVPRRLSWPLKRTGVPCRRSEPKASASAMPKSTGAALAHLQPLVEQLFHLWDECKSLAERASAHR